MKIRLTAVALVATVAFGVPVAGAQADDGQAVPPATTETTVPADTTTTVPGDTTTTVPGDTTTTVPGDTTTTVPGDTTTTIPSELPPATIPLALQDDPRAPLLVNPGDDDSGDIPVNQPVFSSINNAVLTEQLAAATAALAEAQRGAADLQVRIAAAQVRVDDLQAKVDALGATLADAVRNATNAHDELRRHAVTAFVSGTNEQRLSVLPVSDPVEANVAKRYLENVVKSDDQVVQEHREAERQLSSNHAALANDLAVAKGDLANLTAMAAAVAQDVINKTVEVEAYRAGAQVYVNGFVFPVTGEVEFIDSWGYPRMMGTSSAHWHQGSDIMSPMGTPLVACESGTLTKIGPAGLGGNRLWVKGDSGTEYYYAHLSAFAEGSVEGKRVNAGDVVGFVGNTGNAAGGPSHLHFEVHPGGGNAVNPYPLLKAAYGAKPMVKVEVDQAALDAARLRLVAQGIIPPGVVVVPAPVDPAPPAPQG
ncbi:MAG: peptidoglycan DD-metalloendopeptidase family protein [Acidimicrobiales bacterium]